MTGPVAELLRAVPVLATVAAVTALFPTRSVGFVAADRRAAAPSAAFVVLTEDQEDAAVQAAKTAWLASGGRRARGAGGFALGELPETDGGPILGSEALLPPAAPPPRVAWERSAWLPSAAAPAPQPIPPGERVRPPAFSREEMLSIETRKGDMP